jgi:hypothetical protein
MRVPYAFSEKIVRPASEFNFVQHRLSYWDLVDIERSVSNRHNKFVPNSLLALQYAVGWRFN